MQETGNLKENKHICERIHNAMLKGQEALAVKILADLITLTEQRVREEEIKRIKKSLSDELALFIKKWSFEEYGKRYIGYKDGSRLRYEGVVIDLEKRVSKSLKQE